MSADELQVEYVPIDAVRPHPKNARKGNVKVIQESMDTNGVYKPIIVQQSTGYVLAGNHQWKAHKARGSDTVPVIFRDVDDETARRIVLVDNRAADLGTYDADALIGLLKEAPDLAGTGYDGEDLTNLLGDITGPYLGGPTGAPEDGVPEVVPEVDKGDSRYSDDPNDRYTRAVTIPQYEVKGECPDLSELVDHTKQVELQAAIDEADVPDEVAEFLCAAAARHAVFNYRKIAEYYPHAPAEVQALMEASALVIIDVDDAIAHGYVRIAERIEALRKEDRALYDSGYRFDEDEAGRLPEDALAELQAAEGVA